MPIYEIQNKSYNAYRVTVGINGKQRQKYFGLNNCSTNEKRLIMYNRAARLDNKWQAELQAHKKIQIKNAKPLNRSTNTVCCTDVKGIQMLYMKQKAKGRTRIFPFFRVVIAEGRKQVGVTQSGHAEGWSKAIAAYCDFKGIKKGKQDLLSRMPCKSKWEDVKRHFAENLGWDVPEIQIKN